MQHLDLDVPWALSERFERPEIGAVTKGWAESEAGRRWPDLEDRWREPSTTEPVAALAECLSCAQPVAVALGDEDLAFCDPCLEQGHLDARFDAWDDLGWGG